MKTNTIILAAIFAIQTSFLFAGNESTVPANIPPAGSDYSVLVPVTPSEATFEEMETVTIHASDLMPVVPVEAEFEEMSLASTVDVSALAPVVPAVADFEEIELSVPDASTFAPKTPVLADFE